MGSFNRRVGYFLRKLEFLSSSLLIKAEASPLAFQPSHSRRLGTGVDLKDEGRITPPHSVDAPHFFQKVDSRKCTSPDVRLNTCFKKKDSNETPSNLKDKTLPKRRSSLTFLSSLNVRNWHLSSPSSALSCSHQNKHFETSRFELPSTHHLLR